ncbi:MAG: homocysteine S-methyltransferase family protein [Candidatus Acetothermia bacterium]
MEFKNTDELRVFDGAIGTEVQKRAPNADENLTELLNISNPDVIRGIHLDYLQAGAEALTTNTFSANRIRLRASGHGEESQRLNREGARLAREAISSFSGGDTENLFIAGSIGPTGETLVPLGDYTFEQFYRAFLEQAKALKEGGVDWLILETMESLKEAKAALRAAREVGLPTISSMSYGERGRTSYGVVPEAGAVTLDQLGADVLGMNCGTGPRYYPETIETYREFTDKPLLAEANAGDPVLKDGKAVYELSPRQYLQDIKPGLEFLEAVGSCCGSDPAFTRVLSEVASEHGRATVSREESEEKYLSNNATVVPTSEVEGFQEVEVSPESIRELKSKLDGDLPALISFTEEVRDPDGLERDLSRALLQLRSGKPVGLSTGSPEALRAFLRAYPGIAPVRVEGSHGELKSIADKYGGILV